MLDSSGCIVTTYAMGCQTAIVEKAIESKLDYVFVIKENLGRLLGAIRVSDDADKMRADCFYTSDASMPIKPSIK